MKFYFLRHPETLANKQGLIYGWKDYEYTEKGREMFEAMPQRMDAYKFDRIYSSPLGRAFKLAEAIGKRRNIDIITDDRIKEMYFGMLEGMPYLEAREKYPEIVEKLFSDIESYATPGGGESTSDVMKRTMDFLDELKEEDGSVLIVTHAMFMHTAIAYLLSLPRKELWHFKIEPCMIVGVEYKNGFGVLKSMIPFEETDGIYISDIK